MAKKAKRTTKRKTTRKQQMPGKEQAPFLPDRKRALDLLMGLLPIPGKSGKEGEVVRFITKQLGAAGGKAADIRTDKAHKKSPHGGESGNLIFQLPGTFKAPRRLLMGHIDTVPICVGCDPVIKGNVIKSADPATGLGGDNRAGAAVVLNTALEILRRNLPHPPLTFFWPVQEEVGLQGARYAQHSLLGKPKLAFNWDGSSPEKMMLGATGGYRIQIEISGIASHAGAAPEKGVSAVAIAALAIADLQQNGWHGLIEKGTNQGTSNIGVIQGGAATNVVTERVLIRAEARSHNSKFRQRIVNEIKKAFQRAVSQVSNTDGKSGKITFDGQLDYDSFVLKSKELCVKTAREAIRSMDLEPLPAIVNGGLDANWMSARGIPTVTLGCGQRNIHTVGEYLEIDEFLSACCIALRLATVVD